MYIYTLYSINNNIYILYNINNNIYIHARTVVNELHTLYY